MFPNTKFTNTHLSLDSEVCMFMCVHACLVCYIQHFKKFVLFFFYSSCKTLFEPNSELFNFFHYLRTAHPYFSSRFYCDGLTDDKML